MKLRSLLKLVMVLLVGQMIFACSSAKYYEFAPNKPEAYNKVKPKAAPEDQQASPTLSEIALQAAEDKATEAEKAPVLEASAKPAPAPKAVRANAPAKSATVAAPVTVTEAEALEMAKERVANMTKAEKKELKKEVKEALKQDRGGSRTSIVEIILAILLPPLAVFLHDGIGTSFWINIILTLLFFIPGIIHALLVVTDSI